jgi:hypothetical protein
MWPPALIKIPHPGRELLKSKYRSKPIGLRITVSGSKNKYARAECHGHHQDGGITLTHRYNSVKRFVRLLKKKDPERYDRLEFLMGEEAQVDYGQGAPTLHRNGKYRSMGPY